MKNSPIKFFKQWHDQEMKQTSVKIPSACCLSTIGIDGFPNARFVSLKDIIDNNFIITGTLTSRKGVEIKSSEKVALTFWWTETERQVRVQGNAKKVSDKLSDKYFFERNRDSQIVSVASFQGQELMEIDELTKRYEEIDLLFSAKEILRPENWGGYKIEPVRIEFLEFKSTRFHDRTLYEIKNGQWEKRDLQP